MKKFLTYYKKYVIIQYIHIKIKYVAGFITIKGGHRVGITGEVVIENGKVKNISYIYSLNFRIAKQINGASKNVMEHILDIANNTVYNTLIVGTPGTGKTTILKDLIKNISNGTENFHRNYCWSSR